VHALGLAATSVERWYLWERHMRSFGYWKPLRRSKLKAASSRRTP
jgi:hypothetical protein